MFLIWPLIAMVISSTRAGVIVHDVTGSSRIATLQSTSPAAVSHQSITHLVSKAQPRILTTPFKKEAVTSYSRPSGKVVFPVDVGEMKTSEQLRPYGPKGITDPSSSVPYVSYKDHIPILNSASHTPAHLTYSARPVMHQMLPHIVPAPYISYNSYRLGPRN